MEEQKDSLDQRQADCRIWAHILFWWLVPFGWILSTIKMRYGIPVFIMLGALSLSLLTNPYPKKGQNLTNKELFSKSVEHSSTYNTVGALFGSAITVRKILQSRQKTKNSDSLPHGK